MQLSDGISPDHIYQKANKYFMSFKRPLHVDDLLTTVTARRDPGRALDVGCNDGALLDALQRHGFGPLMGVEPNRAAAELARKKGHRVIIDFLNANSVKTLLAEGGPFGTLFMRHVVEHVNELDDLFDAVRSLLEDDGLLVMELPQVEQGMAQGNPAVLWEEHVSYFTQAHAEFLLHRQGFDVMDRRVYAFGGGAMAFVARKLPAKPIEATPPAPQAALSLARAFVENYGRMKEKLRELVERARARDWKVVLYGAGGRSCMIVNSAGLSDALDLVIDDRQDIQGYLLPGTENHILPFEALETLGNTPILCLLGVGAEKEYGVIVKLRALLSRAPVAISLFPPRDTPASLDAALAEIKVVDGCNAF